MLFEAIWMDLQIILNSQSKTNITCYHLYVESENNANELIYKTNSQKYRTNLQSPKGKVGKERNWEYGISRYMYHI